MCRTVNSKGKKLGKKIVKEKTVEGVKKEKALRYQKGTAGGTGTKSLREKEG